MPKLTGVTLDDSPAPLAGVTVNVFRVSTNAFVGSAVSDASGNYSVVVPDTSADYYALAFKAGTPFVAGTTRRNLAGTADSAPVEEVPPGDGTTVRSLWTGTPTPDGVLVSARMNTTKTANQARLVVSLSSDLSNPIKKGLAVVPDTTYRIAKMTLTGLSSNTDYFYGVEIDGVLDTTKVGRFKTLPPVNAPASFRLALGCCANSTVGSASGYPAWQAIRDLNPRPLALLQIGDIVYANQDSAVEADHIEKYEGTLTRTTTALTVRQIPTLYMADDHDFGNDNSTGLDATGAPRVHRQASLDAMRRRVPARHSSSDLSDTLDYAEDFGRVKVIMSDLRSGKWQASTTNTSTRQHMGAAQKQRFKNHITAAAAAGQVVLWCSSVTFVAGDWDGFSLERTELVDHIKAAGMAGRVMVISGDMHAQAYHSGIDYATGGGCPIPVFNIGAMHGSSSDKGGPYTKGPFPAPGVAESVHRIGIADITDDGTNITIEILGKPVSAVGDQTIIKERFALLGAVIAVVPDQMSAPTVVAGAGSAQVTLAEPFTGGAPVLRYTVTTIPAGGIDAQAGTNSLVRNITGITPNVEYKFTSTATNKAGTSVPSPVSAGVIPTAPVTTKFEATGGIVTEDETHKYWTFLASEVPNVLQEGEVDYVLGGGGAGGSAHGTGKGGGGGAGGVRIGKVTIPAGPLAITVGMGGLGGTGNTANGGTFRGQNGGNSSIGTLVEALGGGAGGYSTFSANSGGSGGGGGAGDTSAGPGQGTAGQGYPGGAANPSTTSGSRASGGGGGAGGPGVAAAVNKGGDGGEGITIWGRTIAGGGGGYSARAQDGGVPGEGKAGGGRGRSAQTAEDNLLMNAQPNSCSGGGGSAGSTGSFVTAGNGGSGIVIIRRPK